MRRDYAKRSCSIKSAVKLRRVPTGAVVIQRSILPGKGCGRLTSDSLKSADLIMQMTWPGLIGEGGILNITFSQVIELAFVNNNECGHSLSTPSAIRTSTVGGKCSELIS